MSSLLSTWRIKSPTWRWDVGSDPGTQNGLIYWWLMKIRQDLWYIYICICHFVWLIVYWILLYYQSHNMTYIYIDWIMCVYIVYVYVTCCTDVSHHHQFFFPGKYANLLIYMGKYHPQRLGVQRWEHRCSEFHGASWESRLKLTGDLNLNDRHIIQL